MLCLLVSVHTVNKCPFCNLFGAKFFTFLCFLLVTLIFKMHLTSSVALVQECRDVLNGENMY